MHPLMSLIPSHVTGMCERIHTYEFNPQRYGTIWKRFVKTILENGLNSYLMFSITKFYLVT